MISKKPTGVKVSSHGRVNHKWWEGELKIIIKREGEMLIKRWGGAGKLIVV